MKIRCEVDTEDKSTKFFIDDNEVFLNEFSIAHYSPSSCCDSDKKEGPYTYVSISQQVGDGTHSYSIRFQEGSSAEATAIKANVSVAKEVGKIVNRLVATDVLSKALAKKSTRK